MLSKRRPVRGAGPGSSRASLPANPPSWLPAGARSDEAGYLDGVKRSWISAGTVLRPAPAIATFDRVDAERVVTATRVEWSGEELVFGAEYPADASMRARFAPRTSDDRDGYWRRFRMEVRTMDPKVKGAHLVVAARPYGLGVVFTCPFRRGSQKGASQRAPTAEQRRSGGSEPFESAGKWYVAAADEPVACEANSMTLAFRDYVLGIVFDLAGALDRLARTLPDSSEPERLQILAGPGDSARDGGWVGRPCRELLPIIRA